MVSSSFYWPGERVRKEVIVPVMTGDDIQHFSMKSTGSVFYNFEARIMMHEFSCALAFLVT